MAAQRPLIGLSAIYEPHFRSQVEGDPQGDPPDDTVNPMTDGAVVAAAFTLLLYSTRIWSVDLRVFRSRSPYRSVYSRA